MTFKFVKSSDFTWPIEVKMPADGGRFDMFTFSARFRRLPQSEIVSLTKEDDGASGDVRLMREAVVGWDEIQDEHGLPIPFGRQALDDLLDNPAVRVALVNTYISALSGVKQKN